MTLKPRIFFLLLLAFYLAIAGGHFYSSDGLTMYYNFSHFLATGSFAVTIDDGNRGVLSAAHYPAVGTRLWYGLGHQLLGFPLYLLAFCFDNEAWRWLVISLQGAFTMTAAAWCFYRILLLLGETAPRALLLTACLALATPLLCYAKHDFAEVSLVLVALLSLFCFLTFERDRRRRWLFLAAFWATYGIWIKYSFLVGGGIFLGYYLLRARRQWYLLFAGAGLSLLLMFATNYARFGDIFEAGYSAYTGPRFPTPLLLGLYGLILSPGKGLLLYAPLLLLLGFGSGLHRRRRDLFWFVALLAVSSFCFLGKYFSWHGDHAWGPRYVVFLIPFLMLNLVGLNPRLTRPLLLFALLGFIGNFGGVLVYFNTTMVYGINTWHLQDEVAPGMSPYYLHSLHFDPDKSPLLLNYLVLAKLPEDYRDRPPRDPFDPRLTLTERYFRWCDYRLDLVWFNLLWPGRAAPPLTLPEG